MPADPSTSPTPAGHAADPDDQLAELIADEWIRRAATPGIFRLHALQAAGLLRAPGEITQRQIGSALGLSAGRIQQIEQKALLRTRHRLPADL
jgi:hypothetical protein